MINMLLNMRLTGLCRKQTVIRDSRDPKYDVVKGHAQNKSRAVKQIRQRRRFKKRHRQTTVPQKRKSEKQQPVRKTAPAKKTVVTKSGNGNKTVVTRHPNNQPHKKTNLHKT